MWILATIAVKLAIVQACAAICLALGALLFRKVTQ